MKLIAHNYSEFELYGEFEYDPQERASWIAGELQDSWFDKYPDLFDSDDLRITLKQRRKHYFEWKGAIQLFESDGWFSLIEKFRCKNHKKKQETLRKLLPDRPDIIKFMREAKRNSPDILAYRPDYSDYFFCEMKGGSDRLRQPQIEHFKALHELTGKRVVVMKWRAV